MITRALILNPDNTLWKEKIYKSVKSAKKALSIEMKYSQESMEYFEGKSKSFYQKKLNIYKKAKNALVII